MGNSSGAANPGPTITPNTLSAITGVLNSVQHGAPNPYQSQQNPNNPAYPVSASTSANNPANGLFLLSQAHQELTKREEAQARAGNAALNGVNGVLAQHNGKRFKRKSYDNISPPPSVSASESGLVKAGKRTRSIVRRKGSERGGSEGMDDDEDNEDMEDIEDMDQNPPPAVRKGPKKLETEEEKRRNFLERNRQGD